MKRAIVSDIHGNLEALEAVLSDIADQNISEIYCLGDIVGYGPNPRECIDRAMRFPLCILGNHDLGAIFDPEGFSSGAERAIFWTRAQLEESTGDAAATEARWKFLCDLPRVCKLGPCLYVHGSPRSPLSEYVFPDEIHNPRKIEKLFSMFDQYCFQGHTHVPGVFTTNCKFFSSSDNGGKFRLGKEKLMVNVGSVGQPRDCDSRACYVVLDDDALVYRRVPYKASVTRDKILAIPELDPFLGDRLLEGR